MKEEINNSSTDVLTRYSDEDLQEFKELIHDKLKAAKEELKYFQDELVRNGQEMNDSRSGGIEDGSSAMEKESLNKLASRQAKYIQHLENALIRIENKTYGICRVSGKLINKRRLQIVPHATLSIEAKNEMRK